MAPNFYLKADDGKRYKLPLKLMGVSGDKADMAKMTPRSTSESDMSSEEEELEIKPKDKKKSKKGDSSKDEASTDVKKEGEDTDMKTDGDEKKDEKDKPKEMKMEYKRFDELYNSKDHTFYLAETNTATGSLEDVTEEYVFIIRRVFTRKNIYERTLIDIKSPHLKTALSRIIQDVDGISWTEEKPSCSPDLLFIFEAEMKKHVALLEKKNETKADEKIKMQIDHMNLLLNYLDKDYDATRRRLHALLKENTITFDLLYALIIPHSMIICTTAVDEPAVLCVRWGEILADSIKGDYFRIEASYIDHDGKRLGIADIVHDIPKFRGAVPISSLSAFPFRYHEKYEEFQTTLVERGKKFCSLQHGDSKNRPGSFRSYTGLGFQKKKSAFVKWNVTGRVMVDPLTFRRINANYPAPQLTINASSHHMLKNLSLTGEEEEGKKEEELTPEDEELNKNMNPLAGLSLRIMDCKDMTQITLSNDQYILCSATVLGYSFGDKMWGEFSVDGMRPVEWDDEAFESLVLPKTQKTIIRALVQSHTSMREEMESARNSFDDIIKGKGKGLVAVLHGKPGLGKTLTAESISESLKRPLYALSTGELPTDPAKLEIHLSDVLDVSSCWGAVLLIDEADVFLQKRGINDIHRNALVCVFLRLLEYFQGILILTSNRVETFDEAFQSRIHIALCYTDLDRKAKIQIWKTFINKALKSEADMSLSFGSAAGKKKWEKVTDAASFTEDDYEDLARHDVNGRQIKNAVKTSHALAVNQGERLNMSHIRTVLQVMGEFDRHLNGSHPENLMSYT